MSTLPITVTRDGAIAILTIDRPDAMNAINGAVLDGLRDALDPRLRRVQQ